MRACILVVLVLLVPIARAGAQSSLSDEPQATLVREGLLMPPRASSTVSRASQPNPLLHGFGDHLVLVELKSADRLWATSLCFRGADVRMMTDGVLRTLSLDAVSRMSIERDPLWDGAARGAIVGLMLWKVWMACDTCSSRAQAFGTGVAASAGFGFGWDAMHKSRRTIQPRARLAC